MSSECWVFLVLTCGLTGSMRVSDNYGIPLMSEWPSRGRNEGVRKESEMRLSVERECDETTRSRVSVLMRCG